MINLKKFFNLQNEAEKVADYMSLYDRRKAILKEADVLGDKYAIQKSMETSISDNGLIDPAKYKRFMKEHTDKVVAACNEMASIEKSMAKLESDKECSEAILDTKAILVARDGYEQGVISKALYFEIMKSKQGETRFADTLVFNDKGEILLLQRLDSEGGYTGLWGLPGGHVEPGEDFKDAGARELFEETGLITNRENQMGHIVQYDKMGEYRKDGVYIEYFCVHVHGDKEPLVLNSEEHAASAWVPLCQLDQYKFEYENARTNIEKLTGMDSMKKANTIIKSLQDGVLSPIAFQEICRNNPDIVKAANKHYFSGKEREKLADEGEAMPDGSFPIRNEQDLKDAIRSVGRAKNEAKAKAWIKKRAKEMGKTDLLPDGWVEKAVGAGASDKGSGESLDPDIKKCDLGPEGIAKALMGAIGAAGEHDQNVVASVAEFADSIFKAQKTGYYSDNAVNRKMGRVGQKYSKDKQPEDVKGEKGKKDDSDYDKQAREASDGALKRAAQSLATPYPVRQAAERELGRRKKEKKGGKGSGNSFVFEDAIFEDEEMVASAKKQGIDIKEGKGGVSLVSGDREKVKQFYRELLDPEERDDFDAEFDAGSFDSKEKPKKDKKSSGKTETFIFEDSIYEDDDAVADAKKQGVEIKEGKDGNTIVTGEREKVKEFYHQLLDPEEQEDFDSEFESGSFDYKEEEGAKAVEKYNVKSLNKEFRDLGVKFVKEDEGFFGNARPKGGDPDQEGYKGKGGTEWAITYDVDNGFEVFELSSGDSWDNLSLVEAKYKLLEGGVKK